MSQAQGRLEHDIPVADGDARMIQISSETATVSAKVFSVLPLIVLPGVGLLVAFSDTPGKITAVELALLFTVLLVIAFLAWRFTWCLVDRVVDCGSHLQLQRGEKLADVPFSEIYDVSFREWSRPKKVKVTLWRDLAFGAEFTFVPRGSGRELSTNLTQRAKAAREVATYAG